MLSGTTGIVAYNCVATLQDDLCDELITVSHSSSDNCNRRSFSQAKQAVSPLADTALNRNWYMLDTKWRLGEVEEHRDSKYVRALACWVRSRGLFTYCRIWKKIQKGRGPASGNTGIAVLSLKEPPSKKWKALTSLCGHILLRKNEADPGGKSGLSCMGVMGPGVVERLYYLQSTFTGRTFIWSKVKLLACQVQELNAGCIYLILTRLFGLESVIRKNMKCLTEHQASNDAYLPRLLEMTDLHSSSQFKDLMHTTALLRLFFNIRLGNNDNNLIIKADV